jgi:fatty-acyl-CoA synthase
MHTGDLGTLDEEGYCNIVGRIKDMVTRGGENISPRDVEEFLYRHPAIRDVQVIGVPDSKYGGNCVPASLCEPDMRSPRSMCRLSVEIKLLTTKSPGSSDSWIRSRRP